MPPAPPSEREILEAAMCECRRQLARARDEDDSLHVDLLEADLNRMLERWGTLG